MPVTRGFKGRPRDGSHEQNRLPPGQYSTRDFPVLSAGPTQHTPLERWSLALHDHEKQISLWNWTQFQALPQTQRTTDIHCVTKWTKFDTRWRGVTMDDIFKAAGLSSPPAGYLMAHCDGGYTTNLPVADLLNGKAMIDTHFDGQPLAAAHVGPYMLLVPHIYFLKSEKWVRRLVFMDQNTPGFWDSLVYHLFCDPW